MNKIDSMSKRFDRVELNRRSMKFERPPLLTHKLLVFKLTLCASRTRVPRLHLPRRRLRVPASRRKHYQRWFVLAILFHSAHLNSFVSLFFTVFCEILVSLFYSRRYLLLAFWVGAPSSFMFLMMPRFSPTTLTCSTRHRSSRSAATSSSASFSPPTPSSWYIKP